jgi:hypothetical protein
MRHLFKLAVAAPMAAGLLAGSAAAAPLTSRDAIGAATNVQSPIVLAQLFWRGHTYCSYPDGWHGPGWYRCGYSARTGFGWGGPVGWHGWREGGSRVEERPAPYYAPRRPGGGSDSK